VRLAVRRYGRAHHWPVACGTRHRSVACKMPCTRRGRCTEHAYSIARSMQHSAARPMVRYAQAMMYLRLSRVADWLTLL
jgi:hypothetical protein